jgi:hypothetical protein
MNSPRPLFVLTFVALAGACTTTINADFRGRGDVPANADEINQCKDSCTSQKKAGCFDDNALASCNASCGSATSDGVAQYRDCVSKQTCNPSCTTDLGGKDGGSVADAAPPPDAQGATDAQGGTDAHDAAETAPPDPEIAQCIAACDAVAACFGTPAAKDDCHAKCASAPSSKRQQFIACTSDTIPPQGCDAFCSDCTATIGGHC